MARRIKYKLGDVFIMPLENGLNGVGRVLRQCKATILIELYNIKPFADKSEYSYEEATRKKPLVMHWCYDDGVRKGLWEIVDNQPVPDKIDMPYFWTQDAGDLKYYIRQGTEESFRTAGERTEIQKKDIIKYESYGIGNEITAVVDYKRRLREAGLLEPEDKKKD